MTIAITGLNPGRAINAARAAVPSAHSTASITSSRAWGLRLSNAKTKGSMVSRITSMETT